MIRAWTWLTNTDSGLAARIVAGILIFATLALLDFRRNGPRATRWREYSFLLFTVLAALIYGIINDQITSRISWEYFYYGKGLYEILGTITPPDPRDLHWNAALVGMKATWTAGLIIGVALLLANNPRRRSPPLPQVSYGRLSVGVVIVFAITALCAALLGLAGSHSLLTRFSTDFTEMVRRDEFRPYLFMCVFGIHLGGYVGGTVGTIVAVIWIRASRERRREIVVS